MVIVQRLTAWAISHATLEALQIGALGRGLMSGVLLVAFLLERSVGLLRRHLIHDVDELLRGGVTAHGAAAAVPIAHTFKRLCYGFQKLVFTTFNSVPAIGHATEHVL